MWQVGMTGNTLLGVEVTGHLTQGLWEAPCVPGWPSRDWEGTACWNPGHLPLAGWMAMSKTDSCLVSVPSSRPQHPRLEDGGHDTSAHLSEQS